VKRLVVLRIAPSPVKEVHLKFDLKVSIVKSTKDD
jgi:hypothetical protein